MLVIKTEDEQDLHTLAKQLATSKRVAIICGAGISTAAGIPDFRTATTGLFASLKEKNPDLKITSGKDLFHTNLFQREDTTRAFYQMCAEMKKMANKAPPTEFHQLMKDLDDAGKLFRIYTQNIDSLESKAGLSYGLGEWQERERLVTAKPKGSRGGGSKGSKKGLSQKARGKQRAIEEEPATSNGLPETEAPPASQDQADLHVPPSSQEELPIEAKQSQPQASTSNSPRIHPFDSIQSSQSPSTSLLFGGSSQLNDSLPFPPPSQMQQQQENEVSPPKRKGSTPIRLPGSFEEFEAMYISPSAKCSVLPSISSGPSSSSTAIVPDSQEDAQANETIATTMEEDTSVLTDLSILTDYSNASISEILQMPFCSQESSVSEGDAADTSRNAPILTDFPSLALTEQEASQNQDMLSSQESAPVPMKQIQIQRFLTVPRVIPLHGTLDEMHCPKCNHVEQLERHIDTLESGYSIHCPKCVEQDFSRTALGERSRGVGVLKVSVVLYGEEHKQASRVGEIAEKDLLKAARPDVLLVAGTTLRIPGVKKIVKELAKVIKQPIREAVKDADGNPTGEYTEREDPTKRVIFVNRDPPNPEKTWSEVFDTFVQGDAQAFAKLLRQEIQALRNPPPSAVIPQMTATAVIASAPVTVKHTSEDIVAEVAATILAAQNKAVAHAAYATQVQTSLTSCWPTIKKSSAAPAASQKAVNKATLPVLPHSYSMPSSAPIKLGDALALQSTNAHSAIAQPTVPELVASQPTMKPKVAKVKGPKASKEPKKTKTTKQTQKQKLLDSKTPSPQVAPSVLAEETVLAPEQPKKKEVKVKIRRAPIKSLAQLRAEQAAKAKATKKAAQPQETDASPSSVSAEVTKTEKPKKRPGWRGYAELAEGEVLKPKFEDFENPLIIEGRRRRTSVLPAQIQPRKQASASTSASVKVEPARDTTPVAAGSSNVEDADNAAQVSLFTTFPPLKGSNWPDSAHPSIASTPPSLDSDRDAFSDSDETASYKGEYEVSISQETTCIPPTLSAEELAASLPSSGQLAAQSAKESSSSPVIIEDSVSLEEAASISALSSSQSPVHIINTKNNKRPAASSSQAGPFLTSCSQAVKRAASRRTSTSKRMKIEA